MTTWKHIPHPSIPTRFQACDDGLIRTLTYQSMSSRNGGDPFARTMPQRILKPRINKQNPSLGKHPVVGIYIGDSRVHCTHREFRVARLVCCTFHGVPYSPSDQRQVQQWTVHYKDGDFLNCTAENLSWMHKTNGATVEEAAAAMSLYAENMAQLEARTGSAASFLARMYGEVFGDDEAEENAA